VTGSSRPRDHSSPTRPAAWVRTTPPTVADAPVGAGVPLSARDAFRVDRAGYSREAWLYERAIWAVAVYRLGSGLSARFGDRLGSQPALVRKLIKLPLLLALRLTEVLTGVELPPETTVGPGLRIWHGGNIVVNPNSRIGAGCVLRHGVTIGNLVPGGAAPVIGDQVELGAYAQVLGDVRVGDRAKIGAMSVVLQDVPCGATAVGAPARIVER
jgi:serine O-acetyltransferase